MTHSYQPRRCPSRRAVLPRGQDLAHVPRGVTTVSRPADRRPENLSEKPPKLSSMPSKAARRALPPHNQAGPVEHRAGSRPAQWNIGPDPSGPVEHRTGPFRQMHHRCRGRVARGVAGGTGGHGSHGHGNHGHGNHRARASSGLSEADRPKVSPRAPAVALAVMDDEFQTSYMGVTLGVPVLTKDGEQFGILEHVLAVEEEDIFEGIVVWVGGGGWAERKIQHGLSMGHQSAARV